MNTSKHIIVVVMIAVLAGPALAQHGRPCCDAPPPGGRPRPSFGDNAGQDSTQNRLPDRRRPDRDDRNPRAEAPSRDGRKPDRDASGFDQRKSGRFRGHGPHVGDWLRRYMAIPPAEQQKQLEQDPAFKQLPANRQQRLRQKLNDFNQLPPDQRKRVLNRMETFEQLSPDQQRRARELFSKFRRIDPERRGTVLRELRRLRDMNPDERQKALDSNRGSFSDQERELLKGLTELEPGGSSEDLEPGPGL
ncbi:MAG TPA: DUF3106 domain-containing protein [Clostridia bacterium]|nr:DUF3106 domain-containing protein [Clostridia bacterium]